MLESHASSATLCSVRWSGCWNPAMGRGEGTSWRRCRSCSRQISSSSRIGRSFFEAIARYQGKKADFSDCLIGAKARARGARTTYTFERALAQEQGFTRLV